MNLTKNDNDWFQFCFEDNFLLSGRSVLNVLDAIKRNKYETKAVFSNFEGAFSSDLIEVGKLYSLDSLERLFVGIKQFDWADIFIGPNRDVNSIKLGRSEDVFSCFDMVLSLVDSSYIYIYSKDAEVIERLMADYPKGELKISKFESLDFMY